MLVIFPAWKVPQWELSIGVVLDSFGLFPLSNPILPRRYLIRKAASSTTSSSLSSLLPGREGNPITPSLSLLIVQNTLDSSVVQRIAEQWKQKNSSSHTFPGAKNWQHEIPLNFIPLMETFQVVVRMGTRANRTASTCTTLCTSATATKATTSLPMDTLA